MALEQYIKRVPGQSRGDVMLYALSTCGWCRKTKTLLDDLGVQYDFVYVDQLDGEPKREALERVRALNPNTTFPTMVIDGEAVIGFKEDTIKESLGG